MRRFLITFARQSRVGLTNFLRNSWLSTAATAIMVVTLSIVTVTFIANMTFTKMVGNITNKIDISVYLTDTITPNDRNRFMAELKALPDVSRVTYISKDQALSTYRAENKDNIQLLNAISETDNPLPASFNVEPRDPNKINDIATVINKNENKQLQSAQPSYSGDRKLAIDRIVSIARFFKFTGVAASGVFAIISIMIIFNTIRMAIFNRRDEIEIMKLIGATKQYIRGPFLIEASLYGLIAGIVTLVLSYGLLLGQSENIASYIPEVLDTKAFFIQYAAPIALGIMLLGILIGVVSSMLATNKYLKVYTTNRAHRRFRLKRHKA
jgi:cell division transport system permease protein